MKAKYTYSADSTKLSVSDGANGYDYLGSLIYVRTNGSLSLDRALFDGGALRPNGAVDYFVKDHLGSVRVIVDQAGTVREQNDYYPFGERCPESTYAVSAVNRYKYNGKEEQTVGDLGMLDYGARMYQAGIGRWFVPDPLAEKYYSVSPYAYCNNNPIRYMDPDGRQIVGLTKNDALKVQQDLNTIFAGEKFEKFRNLFTFDKRGKTFNSISVESTKEAFDGIRLNEDEQALVNEVIGVINSEFVYKVEFVSIEGSVSEEGTSAFKTYLNEEHPGVGDAMIPSVNMPGITMNAISGGGINIPTKKGSHSVIMEGEGVIHDAGRAVTTGHEIIGHGVASANKFTPLENNTRAIRVDNLIRRVMGITTFRDEHGGAKIVNPYDLP